MKPQFAATPHATGRRIDLTCTLDRPLVSVSALERPPLRFVRRRLSSPTSPDDGVVVADLTDIFATLTQPWERLERFLFRTTSTTSGDGMIEGDVVFFFDALQPEQARLRFFDPASMSPSETTIAELSRVDRSSPAAAGWREHDRLELFATPGGNPEVSAGVLEIFRGNANSVIANHLTWTPAAGPAIAINFDVQDHWKMDHTDDSTLTFETRVLDGDPGLTWLIVNATPDADEGIVRWSITVRDRGLDPFVHYYYSVFDLGAPATLGDSVALATEDFGSPRALFLRLPGAYQRADEPDPTTPTGAPGQLRRFLDSVGNTTDLARSFAESSRERHDVHRTRLDLVPHLARLIGWSADLTAPGETQRRDVLSAPEIFGSVGTNHNVLALINRLTSWPCQVKEFVNNICLTNAPETIRLWELWQLANDGTSWSPPTQLTLTTDIDGRPSLSLDAGGVVWLFFHSDRGGHREIWRQRLGVDSLPRIARLGASDDTADLAAVDEDPATVFDGAQTWVFWSSDREKQWDIFARTFDNVANASGPIRLTDHPATDRSPAAIVAPGAPGKLWLFWSSERRGPADIWARSLDLGTARWSDSARLTTSPLRDVRPAATIDAAGTLWLFWTRDAGGRQALWYRTFDGTTWSTEKSLDIGHARDEAPSAIPWKGGVYLLWHSNHDGFWQIWGRWFDGTTWHAATRLSRSVYGNKEPAALIDASGDMRVVWRSQRRARRYRSRTLDVNDIDLLESMGTEEDYAHYTYDTGTEDGDWYSRESVGLFLDTSAGPAPPNDTAERVKRFVEPFRAVPVRYVWILNKRSHTEVFTPDLSGVESWDDSAA